MPLLDPIKVRYRMPVHTLVIAAIFVPYMGLMVTLAVYIYRTGRPRSTVREDKPPDSADDGEADLPLAA